MSSVINFDLAMSKAELEASKQQYAELLKIYEDIKARSHPKQLFPAIEKQLHDVSVSIQNHTALIANYEDLTRTMKVMDEQEAEILEQVRKVRARHEKQE